MKNSTQAFVFTICCVLLWSAIPVIARFGQLQLDNYQLLFWSNALSCIVILGCSIVMGKLQMFRRYAIKDIVACGFLGLLGTCIYYLLLYYGYAHGQGIEILVLQYLWPILIVLFAWIILREHIQLRTTIALLLGFIAAILVVSKGSVQEISFSNLTADLVVILGTASFALFSVLSKKFDYEPFTATTLFFAFGAIFSLVFMLIFSSFKMPTSIQAWGFIILNGAFVNGISYVLWLLALARTKASTIAPLVFIAPVLAAVQIVLLFNEPYSHAYTISLVLVITAGLLSTVQKSS